MKALIFQLKTGIFKHAFKIQDTSFINKYDYGSFRIVLMIILKGILFSLVGVTLKFGKNTFAIYIFFISSIKFSLDPMLY